MIDIRLTITFKAGVYRSTFLKKMIFNIFNIKHINCSQHRPCVNINKFKCIYILRLMRTKVSFIIIVIIIIIIIIIIVSITLIIIVIALSLLHIFCVLRSSVSFRYIV